MAYKYFTRKKFFLLLGCLFVILGTITILEFTNHTYWFHKPKLVTGGQYTKGEMNSSGTQQPDSTDISSSNNPDTGEPGDQKSSSGGTTTAILLAPTGDLVSNHHPNLSNSPAPNTISSVCTTTPGATCAITFTMNGVSKSLSSEVTDRGGSAYWNWSLQEIGLTEGSWQIKATATLNGQTKSTLDALELVVSQ